MDCKTGFICDFIYTGSTTEIPSTTELGISGNVVQALVRPYLGKGRKLFVDNWYTILFTWLYRRNTGACGTVKSNRKHMPKFSEKLSSIYKSVII